MNDDEKNELSDKLKRLANEIHDAEANLIDSKNLQIDKLVSIFSFVIVEVKTSSSFAQIHVSACELLNSSGDFKRVHNIILDYFKRKNTVDNVRMFQ